MKLSPDDPKLTAYALGELPAQEAAEVERQVQNSPELQKAVEEIRDMAALLKSEFATEPAAALSKEAKEAVIANAQPDNVVALPNRSFWRTAGFGAIAACLLALIAWQFWLPKSGDRELSLSQVGSATMQTDSHLEEQHELEAKVNAPVDRDKPATPTAQVPETAARTSATPSNGAKEKRDQVVGYFSRTEVAPPQSPATSEPANDLYARTDGSVAGSDLADQESAASSDLMKTQGVGSYEGRIVTSPPVQPLPLVGSASPAATPSVPTGRPASGYRMETRKSNVPSRPAVEQPARQLAESRRFSDTTAAAPAIAPKELALDWKEPSADDEGRNGLPLYARKRHPHPNNEWYHQYNFDHGTARYPKYEENKFESVFENPLSTFSIDVDTASYANVRRFLNEGRMPPKDAVRIEEMINYFSYDYPQPKGSEPFSVNMEVASCPWQPEHRLLRVGLKGKEIARDKRPPSNFVFLIDVSGSMSPQERLPLIKQSLRMLVKRMTENDRIAIVVYASHSGVVLDSTSAVNKEKILEALDRLEAGGSTNGGQGIQKAYALAEEHLMKDGVNRVILCTDGDFNVGITDQDELIKLIQRKAKSGVFLSVLGVGTDNYKDALMQKLADKGNGNYHYIDTLEEGHKVLIQQMNATLVTIAKDVKIQIEFNPAQVSSYRLIGYEKRVLAAEDFNNDKKDAGEIGAGHTVTALYEIVPAGAESDPARPAVDELKYQQRGAAPVAKRKLSGNSREMLTLKLRYKKPDGNESVLREHMLVDQEKKFGQASSDFRFAAAVASFGMILKDSEHKGRANFGSVLELARESKGDDAEGYRAEFINLVKKARNASGFRSEE